MAKFHEKLRKILKHKHWTQKQLAEKLYVEPTTVQKWMSGKNMPTVSTLKEISKAVGGVTVQQLVDDSYDIYVDNIKSTEQDNIGDEGIYCWWDCILIKVNPLSLLYCSPINYRKERGDSKHRIINKNLNHGAKVHRFKSPDGTKYSAIYIGRFEFIYSIKEKEGEMIEEWNKPFNWNFEDNGLTEMDFIRALSCRR